MRFNQDFLVQRMLDCGHIVWSYPAGQSSAVCLYQSSQGIGDLRRRLVAGEDDFGNPGATQPISIDANEWQWFLTRFVSLLLLESKRFAKIGKRRLLGRLSHSGGASVSARSIASFMEIEDTPGASAARNSMLPAGPRSG